MNGHPNVDRPQFSDEAGRGLWLLAACCVPLIVLFTLIALRVI